LPRGLGSFACTVELAWAQPRAMVGISAGRAMVAIRLLRSWRTKPKGGRCEGLSGKGNGAWHPIARALWLDGGAAAGLTAITVLSMATFDLPAGAAAGERGERVRESST